LISPVPHANVSFPDFAARPTQMTTETYGPRTAAWRSLAWHADVLKQTSIRQLLDAEPNRFHGFSRK
jgi:hypothetical protein